MGRQRWSLLARGVAVDAYDVTLVAGIPARAGPGVPASAESRPHPQVDDGSAPYGITPTRSTGDAPSLPFESRP